MELRNRKIIHPPRDYFTANGADQYNLYTPLKRPVRLRRELRGLGLLNNIGEIQEGLRRPEAIPQNSMKDLLQGQREFCQAFLKRPEGIRQCKKKPLRNTDRCRYHNLMTCTPAVREKLEETERIRNTARLQVQEGQRREREAELNARRLRRPHTPDRFNDWERQQIQRYEIRVVPMNDPDIASLIHTNVKPGTNERKKSSRNPQIV
ncbi:hypothetical protein PoB_000135600 [Plakobranchus ocellatus]|uniref:Uncharacterized protein n=1 Tax=Plakobranchus ocellatus TaxID=259542 RepID=A0AAV3XVM8_9GAST|nr:hypothetical protein PoB_000135600 [Plakobranchus ocellatus]